MKLNSEINLVHSRWSCLETLAVSADIPPACPWCPSTHRPWLSTSTQTRWERDSALPPSWPSRPSLSPALQSSDDEPSPVNQHITCESTHHLSIDTSTVNQHITCQSTHHLSINTLSTSPVNQHITCQSTPHLSPANWHITCKSTHHLSINTSPANQHLTCHLPIDTSPVNRHITCQSTHHLPINTSPVNRHITCLSPVNQHVTCQSTRHLSIDTSPVTSQSTRHLSINTPTRHLSIDTSPVTSQSTHHLSIDTSPVTSQSTRHLSIDMSTRHLSSVNQHVPWNCSVFGQKVGLPSSDNLLEVWRARLQRRSCKVVEQLATARLHSRQHRHLQAETENLNFILHILWSITLNCFYVMFYVLYNL